MKTLFGFFFLAIIWTTPALSDDKNSTILNECPGTWELKNYGGWFVYNQNGTTLPIPAGARLIDCLNNEASLAPALNGAEAHIECQTLREGQTIPDIKKIILICR